MRIKFLQFNYEFFFEFIVKYFVKERYDSCLMVVYCDIGEIEYKVFKDILDYFDEEDILIFNNIKVFFVCMYGCKEKIGVRIEVFLLWELNFDVCFWDVLVDLVCKICVGNKLYFSDEYDNDWLVVEVVDNIILRGCMICFLYDGLDDEFCQELNYLGIILLFKILECEVEESDIECFQMVFVKEVGVVVVFMLGLYFSCELMKCFEIKGVDFVELILYIGLGIFCSIDVEDLLKYKMDVEYYCILMLVVEVVNKVKQENCRVCVVGIIVMCVIESVVSVEFYLKEVEGWINCFIYFLFDFKIVNVMVLNFYLLKFSLFIMVSVFGGKELICYVYDIVVKEKYCFFIYGDVMLILQK